MNRINDLVKIVKTATAAVAVMFIGLMFGLAAFTFLF